MILLLKEMDARKQSPVVAHRLNLLEAAGCGRRRCLRTRTFLCCNNFVELHPVGEGKRSPNAWHLQLLAHQIHKAGALGVNKLDTPPEIVQGVADQASERSGAALFALKATRCKTHASPSDVPTLGGLVCDDR
jgi:hypothetical protein